MSNLEAALHELYRPIVRDFGMPEPLATFVLTESVRGALAAVPPPYSNRQLKRAVESRLLDFRARGITRREVI